MLNRNDYDEINKICKVYDIEDYSIDNNGLVNVNGNVILSLEEETEIPISFGKVTGNFNCSDGKLKTLKNSPLHVGGDFDCTFNNISSLVGGPEYVGGSFDASGNSLKNIKYLPKAIKGDLWLEFNGIKSLQLDFDINIQNVYIDRDNLPLKLRNEKVDISVFLKYQNYYQIWNNGKTGAYLNEANFDIFITDILDGLR